MPTPAEAQQSLEDAIDAVYTAMAGVGFSEAHLRIVFPPVKMMAMGNTTIATLWDARDDATPE